MAETALEDVGLELPVDDALLDIAQPARVAVEAGLIVRRQAAASPPVVAVDFRHEAVQEPGSECFPGQAGTAPPRPDADRSGEGGTHFLDGVHGFLPSPVCSPLRALMACRSGASYLSPRKELLPNSMSL